LNADRLVFHIRDKRIDKSAKKLLRTH
jgi:hypothetical protein